MLSVNQRHWQNLMRGSFLWNWKIRKRVLMLLFFGGFFLHCIALHCIYYILFIFFYVFWLFFFILHKPHKPITLIFKEHRWKKKINQRLGETYTDRRYISSWQKLPQPYFNVAGNIVMVKSTIKRDFPE